MKKLKTKGFDLVSTSLGREAPLISHDLIHQHKSEIISILLFANKKILDAYMAFDEKIEKLTKEKHEKQKSTT